MTEEFFSKVMAACIFWAVFMWLFTLFASIEDHWSVKYTYKIAIVASLAGTFLYIFN